MGDFETLVGSRHYGAVCQLDDSVQLRACMLALSMRVPWFVCCDHASQILSRYLCVLQAVFVIRNPKDVAVSSWTYWIKFDFDPGYKDWDYFLKLSLAGESKYRFLFIQRKSICKPCILLSITVNSFFKKGQKPGWIARTS